MWKGVIDQIRLAPGHSQIQEDGLNFKVFMQFLGKIGQKIRLAPKLLGLAPPRQGNSGSATVAFTELAPCPPL